jgi:hypothetical protein
MRGREFCPFQQESMALTLISLVLTQARSGVTRTERFLQHRLHHLVR